MTLTSYSRSQQHFDFQIVTLKNLSAPYPSNQMMDSGKPYVLYCWNN